MPARVSSSCWKSTPHGRSRRSIRKLEVLDAAGNPIPRVVLQAVRPTYFTFRGHNSTSLSDFRLHGWQDMELNEYLYANGEVVKLWMYPRGPDSGFLVYPGVDGNRYTYFGTTAITHALNEPCYIVEPHPPGTKLIPNGLPQYTLYYENDDDGWRKLGADSRVTFHRAGRRRLFGARLRRARPGRRRLQVRARRARAAPRLSNQSQAGRPFDQCRQREGIFGRRRADRRLRRRNSRRCRRPSAGISRLDAAGDSGRPDDRVRHDHRRCRRAGADGRE